MDKNAEILNTIKRAFHRSETHCTPSGIWRALRCDYNDAAEIAAWLGWEPSAEDQIRMGLDKGKAWRESIIAP